MSWSVYVGHFFGAALLANALPHLIAGVTGQRFPSPFGKPPFRGPSSPASNVAWALVNLALSYMLLLRIGSLDLRSWPDAVTCFVGFGLMAFQIPRSLERMRARSRTGAPAAHPPE